MVRIPLVALRAALLLTVGAALSACSSDAEPAGADAADRGITDTLVEADGGDTAGAPDVTATDVVDADNAADPCVAACVPADACEVAEGAPDCATRCATIGADATLACLTQASDCAGLLACIGMVPPKEVVRPFDAAGPYGTGIRDLAGDFTVDTTAGPWTFSETWTGKDSTIFFFTARDPSGKPYAYPATLWASSLQKMLAESPADVHYAFAAYNAAAIPDVLAMEQRVQAAVAALPASKAAQWQGRFHFVKQTLPPPGASDPSTGWLGQWTSGNGAWMLGIDPFQRVRSFGLLYLFPVEAQGVYLHGAAIEAQGWTFERDRDASRFKGEELVVDIAVGKTSKGAFTTDVTLPPPETLAAYDHLEFEMVNDCEMHRVDHCGEWDYLEHVRLCERPTVAENPYATLPCEGTATQTCTCERIDGGTSERVHTCKKDGTGYGACGCACDIEFGRWITTYSREGSWWTDLTPQLAHLQKGGTWPFRWAAPGQPKKCDPNNGSQCWDTPYVVTARMRFQKRGHGMRPASALRVPWPGGTWNEAYNGKQEPFSFSVPAGTKRVEFVALLSGHGFGADVANCAEFCNHTHHVTLNGGKTHAKAHPEAGAPLGCKLQIPDGVVPNQLGTWPLGRGGWCPGLDVAPWRVDLTADAKPEGNVLTYQGLFGGKPYTPVKKEGGSDFWGRIDLSAWVVFYQ
ncbi:MAG: hypothetical protein RIT45_2147 [Pseudomonadota bacterium]